MTADSLRRWCLARPSAVEEFPFGPETSVFKVGGKMFALTALDARPLTVSLKCEPSLAEALRAEHSAVRPGYHLNHGVRMGFADAARPSGMTLSRP